MTKPLDPDYRSTLLELSLGISYGFQTGVSDQFSIVTVNGQTLTLTAGGEDDGQPGNGALITVGGTGDTPYNPTSLIVMGPRTDDELYNLTPYVAKGDTEILVTTRNPSNDDNIFFAAFTTDPPVAGIGTPTDPDPEEPACADYAIFGLRGSGQTASDESGFGREVGVVKDRLEEVLKNNGKTSTPKAIDYDSLGVDSLVGDLFSPLIGWPVDNKRVGESTRYFAESMFGGSLKLQDAVLEYEARCREAGKQPGQMVMIGYSQGAAAVNWFSRQLSQSQRERSSIVTIADPLRHTRDDNNVAFDLGSARPSLGIMQLPQTRFNRTFTPLPLNVAGRSVSLCDARDIVCDTKDTLLFQDVTKLSEPHTTYSEDDLRLAGALAYVASTLPSSGSGGGGGR
jgi:hypothetical protein